MDSVNVNNLLVVSDMPCHYRLSFLNNDYVTLFFFRFFFLFFCFAVEGEHGSMR